MDEVKEKVRKFPVAEIFGPTVQGEGIDQGVPCHFIRFGGCDFKCDWCDTPHAVLPENVRHLPRYSAAEITDEVQRLPGNPGLIVVSGGNPLLHNLGPLIGTLRGQLGYRVSIETQGTLFKAWVKDVDTLCLSPKPPSSGMKFKAGEFESFLHTLHGTHAKVFLKVVVFDQTDYEFASYIHRSYPLYPFYLSAGNDAGRTVGNPGREDLRSISQVRNDLFDRARWLTNRVMVDPEMRTAKVQAQFHVALWGNELGR
jgi:7-carboxy-7-deazaguanine synthase